MLGIVTRSEKGCIIVKGDETWEVKAFPIPKLVDTTGAGDMFAAGFLAGLARGRDMTACGRLGVLAAAEIIQAHWRPAQRVVGGAGERKRRRCLGRPGHDAYFEASVVRNPDVRT